LRLPFAAAAAPVALAGNLLVPTLAGEVVVRNVQGGPALEPFQPKLAGGTQISWLRPTVTPGGDILLADGAQRLYRLVVQQQPRPHLESKATADLARPIATSIAVIEQTVLAGDVNGRLLNFALADLKPGNESELGSPIAWGPVAVGECVLVSTRANELYCFDGQPAKRWQVPLPYGPLAGDPVLLEGKLVLASTRGVVWSIDPANGQEASRVELNQPLASAAIPVGAHLILAGPDGVLHRIAKP
jgi:outer membrane protein assembly factor BamB